MSKLQRLGQQDPQWSLEAFVDVANDMLSDFLPEQEVDSRLQDTVNPRLVRHYTTQGLLDKPRRQGREARYGYRHLLQLLVLRRLLTEGYSASSITGLIAGMTDTSLEDLLQGGAQLTVEAANPALAFLSQVRDRNQPLPTEPSSALKSVHPPSLKRLSPQRQHLSSPPPSPDLSPQTPSTLPPSTPVPWTRLEILDGLELHLRNDFVVPATTYEREQLLRLIAHHLTQLYPDRRFSP